VRNETENWRNAVAGLACNLALSLISLLGVAALIAMIVLPLMLAFSATAVAHHSAAAFDATANATVEGVVTRFDWRSPHVYLRVKDRQGIEWVIEGGPPGVLTRAGVTRDTLRAGQKVIVQGRPNRDPSKHEMLFVSVSGADGKPLPMAKPA